MIEWMVKLIAVAIIVGWGIGWYKQAKPSILIEKDSFGDLTIKYIYRSKSGKWVQKVIL